MQQIINRLPALAALAAAHSHYLITLLSTLHLQRHLALLDFPGLSSTRQDYDPVSSVATTHHIGVEPWSQRRLSLGLPDEQGATPRRRPVPRRSGSMDCGKTAIGGVSFTGQNGLTFQDGGLPLNVNVQVVGKPWSTTRRCRMADQDQQAALREVKKDSPNKGKFFWTCATYPFCNFFLWRDEAVLRETGLPLATHGAGADVDKPQEQHPPKPAPPSFTQRPLTSFGVHVSPTQYPGGEGAGESSVSAGSQGSRSMPRSGGGGGAGVLATPSSSSQTLEAATPCPTPSKRKRGEFGPHGGEEDTGLFSDLDSDDERQLADMADRSAEKTRRQAGKAPASPSLDRAVDTGHGLHTPSVARTLFTGPDAKRQKTVSFEHEDSLISGIPTPAKTPSTTRTSLQQSSSPPSSSPGDPAHDPAEQIMTLLCASNTDPTTLRSVQDLLETSARRTKGILLGRDSARAALKQRDDRIAQLQERVRALENKQQFQNRQLTNIKAQLTATYDDSQ
ncbi:Zinc finger, GRF-type [Purpureocillium lavendulum]|uniref:Zinc finger, GRF-type n=1 Tax=Purpureocillium lavendulum TaxID=1247861 RepID=A0AB34G485_9HYPO|nr:Zinc finger, GRF-type [Purpureocillium lavendulum]